MTTQKLMEMTLRKLDRPTDNSTVALYKERLLGYLNEAILDLTAEFRPWRRARPGCITCSRVTIPATWARPSRSWA